MTNQNIHCWQETLLRYLGPFSILATPVDSLAKQFHMIRRHVCPSSAAKKALEL